MKKILLVLSLVAIFALTAFPVFAADPLGTGYTTWIGLSTQDVRISIMRMVNALLGFLGVIAVLIVLWGGFRWMTSSGNEEKVGEAKKIMAAGVIGLIIILLSFGIANFVVSALVTATTG